MVTAGLGRPEPHSVVVTGDYVHFHAESRDIEIVNDVFAGENQADVAADGDVKLVDLALAVGLLGLPHPLLADDVNVQGVLRRAAVIHIDDRAPSEHPHGQEQRNDHPGGLKAHVTVHRNTQFVGTLAMESEKEKDNRDGDGDGEKQTDRDEENHQAVHVGREVGGLLRIQWQLRLHG